MKRYIYMALWTLVPALELRFSIPWYILNEKMHWAPVFAVCVITNIVLGFVVFFFIEWIIGMMMLIGPVGRLWHRYVERVQRKIHAGVEKYGEWAVAVFIGIPLPGSGVYTGALAAYLIGLSFRKFVIANILGVLIAGVIVTSICLTGPEFLMWMLKINSTG